VVEETDRNLVVLAQNGDHQAFRQLVERYQRKVYSVTYGMVRNPEDAMDMTQDAFIKAYKNLGSFQGSSSFYTWIYRIAVNLCIDHLRKAGRVQSVDYDDKFKHDQEDVSDGSSLLPSRLGSNPERAMGRRELVDQMQKALEELSPNHRTVILLREVEGLSYEEIAQVLDISKGTVMSRLHHARKNMQAALSSYVGKRLKVE
jgi:RNA polymerase sigma-70 factor (ECF subfamily)